MKRTSAVLAVLVIVSMVLGACGATPTATPQPAPTMAPAPTATTAPAAPAATATAVPTAAPTKPAGTAVDNVTISQPVEITFWHVSTQTQGQNLQAMVDAFNASHPNITVKAEYQGSYTDIRKKILAAITAGTTPDIAVA
jgi:ABC-type glycerol-3-phosphate transport system substrate-binding protein